MEYKCQPVLSAQIVDTDSSFRISTGNDSINLTDSIARIGLIHPPILLTRGNDLIIVSGFARIAACNRLGYKEFPAQLLDEDTPVERCIEIAIIDNSSQRSLNLVEQARALKLLASIHKGHEAFLKAAKMVGLPVDLKMAEKLRQVSQMALPLQHGLVEGTIALPAALQLHNIQDDQVSDKLGALLRELGLSLNRQREFIDWVTAIACRDAVSILQVVDEDSIKQIRHDTNLDRRQKSQQIRNYLKKRRYPVISVFEREYTNKIKQLKLKKGTHLLPPSNFEGQTYSLRFDFQNHNDLSEKYEEFKRLVQSPIMKSLWDPFDVS